MALSLFYLGQVHFQQPANAALARTEALEIWDLAAGEMVRMLDGYTAALIRLAAGVVEGRPPVCFAGLDNARRVRPASADQTARTLSGAGRPITALALSPDSRQLAAASQGDAAPRTSVEGRSRSRLTLGAGAAAHAFNHG